MKALLLVDLQNDFFPGGTLPVPEGDQIIPTINALLDMDWDVIVASKDWHPANHKSFASEHEKDVGDIIKLQGVDQILWPDHCVQKSKGAEFYPGWDITLIDKIVFKGTDPLIDSYSAFFDDGHRRSTGLNEFLKEYQITDVYCAGLATDYCVRSTVLDALELGYKTFVVTDGIRGVDLSPNDSQKALDEMNRNGAIMITLHQLLNE
ncbi:MAG: Peroxyureidoacrylate/ureidoacrylate amidohydrolase RutB [Chlamydiae bacterium]|nr:Peroxyureidoacrylate/ureidoacrylate amidohydrolase RutB [Chlamydiota bacterium]